MLRLGICVCLVLSCGGIAFGEDGGAMPMLKSAMLGETSNVHAFGNTLLCGQPSPMDFAEAKRRGIKTVISLRQADEINWDESGELKKLGLSFHHLGFRAPDTLNDEIFEKSLQLLSQSKQSPVLLHCASANRVGAIWLAHRVVNDGVTVEQATREAKQVGLRTAGYETKALAFIRKKENGKANRKADGQGTGDDCQDAAQGPEQKAADEKPADEGEASVKPGINDRFKDPKLDVSEFLGRFELESREVYAARERVLAITGIKSGQTVADIGAGTGFYSRLFSSAVGAKGWVYSVDISPRFLEHINERALASGIDNITCVLCSDRAVRLPANSVDAAFICDTYHHFEYPKSTLTSILAALKPGGTLVVIDFERIPGESREFILGHVRAGKEVFQSEIVDAGFQFVEEAQVPGFKENYLLRFRKPSN
ncbi:MAG: methyltransferase domain-containing protein [Planctomycetales bacterium]|nr:methyltransferase domain-containing protein [Planctomycetales bacterium]